MESPENCLNFFFSEETVFQHLTVIEHFDGQEIKAVKR